LLSIPFGNAAFALCRRFLAAQFDIVLEVGVFQLLLGLR